MNQNGILKWPTPGEGDAELFGLILTVVLILIVALFVYQRVHSNRQHLWTVLVRHLQKRGLNQKEVQLLKSFFYGMPQSESEQIFLSPLAFYKRLYEHFSGLKGPDANLEVRILDKLFCDLLADGPVTGIRSLRSGEICSLELSDSVHLLAKVIEGQQNHLTLAIPDLPAHQKKIKHTKGVSLFVYRQDHGAYHLQGQIPQVWEDGAVFQLSGPILHQGFVHRMCNLQLACELEPWPQLDSVDLQPGTRPGQNDQATLDHESGKTPAAESADSIEPPLERMGSVPGQDDLNTRPPGKSGLAMRATRPIHIQAQSHQISDRALTFTSDDALLRTEWSKFPVWEISLELPDGYHFKCRGKILAPRSEGTHFIFKYLDISENSRKILFTLISTNNPVREKLI
ncbi:MAG: hypothetical protein KDK39_14730 [Leptospiraceae bacterium]|nr:hypothetical protein [Leptospiraceae bacterium]